MCYGHLSSSRIINYGMLTTNNNLITFSTSTFHNDQLHIITIFPSLVHSDIIVVMQWLNINYGTDDVTLHFMM